MFERYDEFRLPQKYLINGRMHKSPPPLPRSHLSSIDAFRSQLSWIEISSNFIYFCTYYCGFLTFSCMLILLKTSMHHTPRDCLQENLQIILGQLAANVKALGQLGDKLVTRKFS